MTAQPTLAAASFTAWLAQQVDRDDRIGELARFAAAADPALQAADFEAALGWAFDAGLPDDLLEVALPAAGAEFGRTVGS